MGHHGATAKGETVHGQQHAADIGEVEQAGRSARGGAALHSGAGVGEGLFMGGGGRGHALGGDIEAGVIHHDEHAGQPLSGFAEQVGLGTVEPHLAGGRGVEPHLLLDAGDG